MFFRDNRPHYTELYLSIYQPNVLFTGLVNDSSIAKNARIIPYTSASGTTDIEDRICYVGTTPGGFELGKVRVRYASSGSLYVGENSDVFWQHAAYLTVMDYVEVQPVFPRIIQNPSNPEQTIFYKDYDIPYTNQNSVLGAFVCAGPHQAGFLEDGKLDIFWTATGTTHLGNSSMSYAWEFGGVGPEVTGTQTLWSLSADYSSVQGQGDWYYRQTSGTAELDLVWNGTYWVCPYNLYIPFILSSSVFHPGLVDEKAKLVWSSTFSDSVSLTGTVTDIDPNSGNGIIAYIYKNDELLWSATIPNGNSSYYELTTLVEIGDEISFQVSGNGNFNSDSTSWNPSVVRNYVTSPTSSLQAPGWKRYTSPGHYVTKLTVTGANGSVDTVYRYVSVYDPSNPPILNWTASSLRGGRQEGGYTTDVRIHQDLGYKLQGGELVVIFDKTQYANQDSTYQLDLTQDNIFFVGYVLKGTVNFDYKTNEQNFSLVSVTDVMKSTENFVVSVESKVSPSTWYELKDLNGKKAFYHYLRWHSTVLSVTDFRYDGLDYPIQFFDTDKTSLFESLQNFFSTTYWGSFVCDRKGRLVASTNPEASMTPTSRPSVLFNLENFDWVDRPQVEYRLLKDVSYLEAGGIAYSGPLANVSTPLLCGAPGVTPSYSGKSQGFSGLALEDQAQLNRIGGNLWAKLNSDIRYISLRLNGTYKLDLAFVTGLDVSFTQEQLGGSNPVSGRFQIIGIEWNINPDTGMVVPTLTLEKVVDGVDADTITIKTQADVDLDFQFNPVPFNFPPFDFNLPPIYDPLPSGYMTINIRGHGIWWTDTFYDEYPMWYRLDTVVSGTANDFYSYDVTSYGRVYATNLLGVYAGNLGGTFEKVADFLELPALIGPPDFIGTSFFYDCMADPNDLDSVIISAGYAVYGPVYLISVGKNTRVLYRIDRVDTFFGEGRMSWGDNEITYTHTLFNAQPWTTKVSRDLTTLDYFAGNGSYVWHNRAGTTGKLISATPLSISDDGGEAWTVLSTFSGSTAKYGADISPDGTVLFAGDNVNRNLFVSYDSGLNWTQSTGSFPSGTLPTGDFYEGIVHNMGNNDEWVIAHRGDNLVYTMDAKVLYTPDGGVTWLDKTGNLSDQIGDTKWWPRDIKGVL